MTDAVATEAIRLDDGIHPKHNINCSFEGKKNLCVK